MYFGWLYLWRAYSDEAASPRGLRRTSRLPAYQSRSASRSHGRGIEGPGVDSRWTMLSEVRDLPSASSYLSLVASPSTKTRVLQTGK